jgi:hypothetical protein
VTLEGQQPGRVTYTVRSGTYVFSAPLAR